MVKTSEITFTKEEVQKVMMECFIKGENWGMTYAGWFNPTDEQKAKQAAADCESVYKNLLISKL